jgi:hypothetical protein
MAISGQLSAFSKKRMKAGWLKSHEQPDRELRRPVATGFTVKN